MNVRKYTPQDRMPHGEEERTLAHGVYFITYNRANPTSILSINGRPHCYGIFRCHRNDPDETLPK